MERLTTILLVAGLGCFALAFVLSGWYPYAITDGKHPETSIEELAQDVSVHFKQLKESYPVSFSEFPGADKAATDRELAESGADDAARAASDAAWSEAYAHALRRGRDRYIAEACWHCHSQYVRPVSNEEPRYGPVLTPADDNNELQRPVLYGTRRVGPDLTHEGGKRSNDWHVAHFWDPQSTSPGSIMPRYEWFLREGYQVRRRADPDKAARGGLPADTTYEFPGIHDNEKDAAAAMEQLKGSLHEALQDEAGRMLVERARGPTAEGLSMIAYLQWRGTWKPKHGGDDQ